MATNPESEGLLDATLPVSCGVLLIGLVFQLKCREVPLENAKLPAISAALKPGTEEFGVAFGLVAHSLFIVGLIAFAAGLLVLGLALKLAPQLAVFPMFGLIVSLLWFMRIAEKSPIGLPGLKGPPLPALVINTTILLVILINMIVNWDYLEFVTESADGFENFSALARLILVSCLTLVPHLIAFKHRQIDWKVQPAGVTPQ